MSDLGLQETQKSTFSHVWNNERLAGINGHLPEMSSLKDCAHCNAQAPGPLKHESVLLT